MGIADDAFRELWPEKGPCYDFYVKYSGKFKGFNANVRLCGRRMSFNLSRNWRGVGRDIKIGLIQELMGKILKDKKQTANIDLYHIFLKKVHIAVPKIKSDPVLEQAFNKVNEQFFFGMIEAPNLVWNSSARKLGSYDYGSDTITISRMLESAEPELMEYVMYHEMLHKKHKFSSKGGRLYHHTSEFRSSERAFPDSDAIEKKLRYLRPSASMRLQKNKRKNRKKFSIFGIRFG